jgi:hypothetical protein
MFLVFVETLTSLIIEILCMIITFITINEFRVFFMNNEEVMCVIWKQVSNLSCSDNVSQQCEACSIKQYLQYLSSYS